MGLASPTHRPYFPRSAVIRQGGVERRPPARASGAALSAPTTPGGPERYFAHLRNHTCPMPYRVALCRGPGQEVAAVFPSALGWMAMLCVHEAVKRLVFGYPRAKDAVDALFAAITARDLPIDRQALQLLRSIQCVRSSAGPAIKESVGSEKDSDDRTTGAVIARLQAFAQGTCDDFRDVKVHIGHLSSFQQRVLACCRQIPFASVRTYGEVAAAAGCPGAARAVGACMAKNPIPIIIPCHRVVAADGSLGGYSAFGGVRTKRRLLTLEAAGMIGPSRFDV